MRPKMLALTLLAAACSFQAAKADDGPAIADSDPLAPLKMRIGTWTVKSTARKAAWTPETTTVTVTEKIQWALDKKFIQGTSSTKANDQKGLWLANYAADAKVYRFWYFDNKNTFPRGQSVGRWNPKTKTLNWKLDFGNGVHGVASWKYVSADRFEWSLEAHDREGKLVLDMSGVATRKK